MKCVLNVFLFSAGDESGEFHELDGFREICGHVSGGKSEENISNV